MVPLPRWGRIQRGAGDRQGGVPVGGEGGVFGAAPGEGGAVDAERAGGVARVAGAAQLGEEGGVLQRLGAGEGAG